MQIQIKKTQIQTNSSMIGFDKHQIQKQTQIQVKVRIHRWQGLSDWQASEFHRHCSKQNKPLRPQTFKMSKFWQEWTQDDWWKCGFLEKASECSLRCVCLLWDMLLGLESRSNGSIALYSFHSNTHWSSLTSVTDCCKEHSGNGSRPKLFVKASRRRIGRSAEFEQKVVVESGGVCSNLERSQNQHIA